MKKNILNQINVILLLIIGLLLAACLLQATVKLGSESKVSEPN